MLLVNYWRIYFRKRKSSGSTNGPGGTAGGSWSTAFIETDAPPHHRIFFSPDLKQQHNKLRKLATYPTDLRILPPATHFSQRRLSSPDEAAKLSSLQSQRRLSAPLDQRRRVEFGTSTRFSPSPEPGSSSAGNFYHESENSLQDSVLDAIISGDFMPDDDGNDDDNYDSLGGPEQGKNVNRRRTESSASGMSVDIPSDSSPQDEGTTTNLDESCRQPSAKCCGQHVIFWCPRLPPVDRIAVAVARFAPCFLLCPLKTVTDRAVLGRLNVLLAIFSVFPIVAATFLAMILYDPHIVDRTLPLQWNSPPTYSGSNFYVVSWNLNATEMLAGAVSVVIFVSNLLTARVVRDVNLVGANRYWIALNWVLPFLGFAAVALFDYFDVTNVWIIHWWREPIMAWFRRRYCVPGTYTTLCTVPQSTNETEWCLVNYNATNCAALRDEAQYKTNVAILIVFYLTAICCIFLLVMISLALHTLERIMTKPIVAKQRKNAIPYLVTLPMLGCFGLGAMFAFTEQSALNTGANTRMRFTGPLYLATGALFLLACVFLFLIKKQSILNETDKKKQTIGYLCHDRDDGRCFYNIAVHIWDQHKLLCVPNSRSLKRFHTWTDRMLCGQVDRLYELQRFRKPVS